MVYKSFGAEAWNAATVTQLSQREHEICNSRIVRDKRLVPPDTGRYKHSMHTKRKSAPKTRTGCTTCKIRHVKCDEGKPNCIKCTSTGRKCDGYEFVRSEKTNVVRPVQRSLPKQTKFKSELSMPFGTVILFKSFEGTVQERRMFHRFRLRSIPALAKGSETEFWNTLVLQAATEELVIREALIALGTLHEDFEAWQGKYEASTCGEPRYPEATLLYGRAIRHLYERIDRSPGETAKLAIIASILFTCFEVLRRNDMAAIIHYQAGMRELVRQMNIRHLRNGGSGIMATQIVTKRPRLLERPQDDFDSMLRVFARYDIQACTFAKPKAETLELEDFGNPPDSVEVDKIEGHLEKLLIVIYQLMKSDCVKHQFSPCANVPSSRHQTRKDTLEKLQSWVKAAMIMLKTSLDSDYESSFDEFEDQFENMVSRVESLTQAFGIQEAEPLGADDTPFAMELGIIHPLFYIGCKCRNWGLRRRAIAQLRRAGKEGVWDGPVMAVVAQRIAQIEEQGLNFGDIIPERARIHAVRKEVHYDRRVVSLEMRLASEKAWEQVTVLREILPF